MTGQRPLRAPEVTAVHGRCLVFSCEHGGREVPTAYAGLFAGHQALLDSHRGWDPGALQLGQQMAGAFAAPLYASTTTRLLIDLNRTVGHRQLHSEMVRGLTRVQRQQVVAEHYRPHRDAVESEIACRIAENEAVIHIASHSFTPVFGGIVRRADVAWLYDPRRPGETLLARRWQAELAQRAPGLRLRRNYPYQGRSDGLASHLRKRHPDASYVGIELEVNQRFVLQGGASWKRLRLDLVESLDAALLSTPLRRRAA
ncbi:MAG: N-formylglutamate amidohydrolase [Rubrivivax sp.]